MTALDPERALIGAMLLNSDACKKALESIEPSDFGSSCAEAFKAIRSLYSRGFAIDALTVADEWKAISVLGPQLVARTLVSDLLAWQTDVPSSAYVGEYARLVQRNAYARRASLGILEARSLLEDGRDPYQVVETLVQDLSRIEKPVEGEPEAKGILELAEMQESNAPWVVPDILRQDWRVVVVATSGSGKSSLLRQMAQCASQGWHPFRERPIKPVRSLIVDLENPLGAITPTGLRIVRRIEGQTGLPYNDDTCRVWRRPQGLNLRMRAERQALEREVAAQRPSLVCIGPGYKMTRKRNGESWDEAVDPVFEVLDDLRTRYSFGLVIEHHVPKSSGGYQSKDPYGSMLWMAWPELGLTMVAKDRDKRVYCLERNRTDRLVDTDWPTTLERGESYDFPWIGRWE